MARISDLIEEFIKTLLAESEGELELQRNELANYFNCAPSQINYVLATRFSLSHGYYIESYRGGGGHIRIIRLNSDKEDYLYYLLTEGIPNKISERDSLSILVSLKEQNLLSQRELEILKAVLRFKALGVSPAIKDNIRANILKAIVTAISMQD